MCYSEWLENKKVLIVGPSCKIDNDVLNQKYDVYVSPNCSFLLYPDLNFNVFYIDCLESRIKQINDYVKNKNIERSFVASANHSLYDFPNSKFLRFPIAQSETGFIGEVKKITKNMGGLSTGFISILHILQFNIESLTITGMDFYRSAYNKDYMCFTSKGLIPLETTKDIKNAFRPGETSINHNPDYQYQHFKNHIFSVDKRVKVDKFMSEYLMDDKYDFVLVDPPKI